MVGGGGEGLGGAEDEVGGASVQTGGVGAFDGQGQVVCGPGRDAVGGTGEDGEAVQEVVAIGAAGGDVEV